jgi:orotate phosphoribosyltransferase
MTTGSTVNACAAALKNAGAAHVSVLTLVRADRRLWPSSRLAGWKPVLSEAGVTG